MQEMSGDSRRDFIVRVGQIGAGVAALGTLGATSAAASRAPAAGAEYPVLPPSTGGSAGWDLSWVKRVEAATDRAVFDSTQISDGIALDIATRYLDNCVAAYGSDAKACAVLNVRTRSIALGFSDAMWSKYQLGAEYSVTDPVTKQPAVRNPFMTVNPGAYPGTGSITDLVRRGSVILVCDFALGHLSNRLATKAGKSADEVHAEIKASLVPGAFMVPSGIFGSARAQNAGAALIVT